jgi:co-chaperonin GroES (HSP10)
MEKLYEPLGNRVLITKIKLEEEKKGGVIIPFEITQQKHETDTVGIVKALGNSVDKTLDLHIGAKVKYAKHSQVELEEGILLVKDVDIQAIIHEGEES